MMRNGDMTRPRDTLAAVDRTAEKGVLALPSSCDNETLGKALTTALSIAGDQLARATAVAAARSLPAHLARPRPSS